MMSERTKEITVVDPRTQRGITYRDVVFILFRRR